MREKKWRRSGVCLLVCLCVGISGCGKGGDGKGIGHTASAQQEYTQDVFAMDTYMSLLAYGPNGKEAVEAAVEEIKRLDALWSVSSENGEVYQVNANGRGVLSEDTVRLVKTAQQLYKSTEGAFDLTVYPLMELWGFTTGEYQVPSENRIAETLQKVDQSRISLDGQGTLTLGEGQKMDLGGIAKGYTSSRIMEIYKEHGVTSGMVSLGGNVQTLGTKPDGSKWKIGIQDPDSKEGDVLGVLSTADQAVITSGGYERYFEEDGQTYHHILDTHTGYPADSGLVSVSIVSADGTLADGLSTALFVMGKEQALAYWRQHRQAFDAILVEEDGTITVTEGLQEQFTSEQEVQIADGQ